MGNKTRMVNLDSLVANTKIEIPRNPFLEEAIGFGTDELIGAAVSIVGVLGTGAILDTNLFSDMDVSTKAVIITASAPVIEKSGFFFRHIYDAIRKYMTTVPEERRSVAYYASKAIKGGMDTLVWDIAAHDPIYCSLLYYLINTNPDAGAATQAAFTVLSFLTGLVAASGIKTLGSEVKHRLYTSRLLKAGLENEKYFEARFKVSKSNEQKQLLDDLASTFDLHLSGNWVYSDNYFENNIPSYSGRIPKLRLRYRYDKANQNINYKTAQIVFTRANEEKLSNYDQFRYFISRKEKIYSLLDSKNNMPATIEDIEDLKLREFLKRIIVNPATQNPKSVHFERAIVYNPDSLLISADCLDDPIAASRDFYVVEVKARKGSTNKLMQAMRYLMLHYGGVEQTTDGKLDILHAA